MLVFLHCEVDVLYSRIEKTDLPEGYVRAYKLSNKDVVQIFNLLLEFENNIFYEVIKEESSFDSVGWITFYKRTGRKFTAEELNKMF